MSAPIDTRLQHKPKPLTVPPKFGGLTLKQNAFIDNYIETGNATDAAVKAGYTEDRNSAASVGSQLLRNLKIADEIKRRLKVNIASAGEVLETLTKHARGDLTDLIDSSGQFNLKKARRKRLLKKLRTKKTVRYTRDGERIEETHTEYEIHDPQSALEKLGRFHQLFPSKVELALGDLDAAINAAIEKHALPQAIETTATVSDCLPVDQVLGQPE